MDYSNHTLSKIPETPKFSTKKLLKELPDVDISIPSKIVKQQPFINKSNPKTKSKIMTKKEEAKIMKIVNAVLREVAKLTNPPNKRGKLTEEEKLARREERKEATRLKNLEKKENMKQIKADARAKLAEHKKALKAEQEKIERLGLRRSKEIDELKRELTLFRRYVRYLPNPDKISSLDNRGLQSALDYSEDARQYYRNSVSLYKKYKKEGLISKEDLDKLLELSEVTEHLEIMNNVSSILRRTLGDNNK
jgi:hypothetical protein